MREISTFKKLFLLIVIFCVTSCREEYVLPITNTGGVSTNHSGCNYVSGFGSIGSKVLFAVQPPKSGSYKLEIIYVTTTNQTATASLYINGKIAGEQLSFPETSDKNDWQTIERQITLNQSVNYIAIQYDAGDNGQFNLDYILIK